jgi:hypothetical protein
LSTKPPATFLENTQLRCKFTGGSSSKTGFKKDKNNIFFLIEKGDHWHETTGTAWFGVLFAVIHGEDFVACC